MRKLSEAIEGRPNNLNLIKCIAFMMVIVSHAYAFAIGYATTDWYSSLTDGRGDLGGLAVSIFFFYSGLLITRSLMKNSEWKSFWKRRFVRIYPAYALVLLLIVFVAAPVISSLGVMTYFSKKETYQYLGNLFFVGNQYLPGVFGGNAYGQAVNGPLWTVRLEVVCYIVAFCGQKLGLLKKKSIWWTLALYMVLAGGISYLSYRGMDGLAAVLMPMTMFYLGMIFAVYADRLSLNGMIAIASGIIFVIASILGYVMIASVVGLPYVLCYLAFATKYRFNGMNRLGEYSYEAYLWGGFVGQFITYMCGGYMSVYLNMLITIPASMILGYLTAKVVDFRK